MDIILLWYFKTLEGRKNAHQTAKEREQRRTEHRDGAACQELFADAR